MPNDPSANAPIELPEVLQKELESFFPDAAPPGRRHPEAG